MSNCTRPPGAFTAYSFGDCGRGHIRCCYAAPHDLIEEALERIRRFVGRL